MQKAGAFALALLATSLAACAPARDRESACTLMGAVSSTQVEVSADLVSQMQRLSPREQAEGLVVEACAKDACHQVGIPDAFTVTASNFVYVDGVDPAEDKRLVVSLIGAKKRVLASTETPMDFETVEPNGPGCGTQVVMKGQTVRLD